VTNIGLLSFYPLPFWASWFPSLYPVNMTETIPEPTHLNSDGSSNFRRNVGVRHRVSQPKI
jgi:hypothetical protein